MLKRAIIDVFDACNLRCPVCPTGSGQRESGPARMILELFEQLLSQLPGLDWGEPLLHPDISAILERATRRKIATVIHIHLNGTQPQSFFDDLVPDGLGCLDRRRDAGGVRSVPPSR